MKHGVGHFIAYMVTDSSTFYDPGSNPGSDIFFGMVIFSPCLQVIILITARVFFYLVCIIILWLLLE